VVGESGREQEASEGRRVMYAGTRTNDIMYSNDEGNQQLTEQVKPGIK